MSEQEITTAREKLAQALLDAGVSPGDAAKRVAAIDAQWTDATDYDARIQELRGAGMSFGEIARTLSQADRK
ncbi:hypothetical protein amrb99_24780 [Actinomadura sp. RB99]|uniref:hypothetical protein n=1 Tax=Actinomadura sp. RB99 TaxID=2691577 RepID=UPI001687FB56|nr:hypothetical protein [Actinomadura sp. RB99]MBD2893556.1 hypothetical protein [Actinomadura sp. RB99]